MAAKAAARRLERGSDPPSADRASDAMELVAAAAGEAWGGRLGEKKRRRSGAPCGPWIRQRDPAGNAATIALGVMERVDSRRFANPLVIMASAR